MERQGSYKVNTMETLRGRDNCSELKPPYTKMKRAIVIGCKVSGIGVIRSLGVEGFKIVALYYDRTDFAHASRYVYEKTKIPNPRTEEKEFVDFLIRNSGKWKDALLLETNDDIAVAISKNKDELEKHYKIATPGWDVLRRFIEKSETYRLAEKCNVPYPKTFLPKTLDELDKIKDEIAYPCILKPVRSHEFFSKFRSKSFKVSNYGELLSRLSLCLESRQEMMVQEIIPGPPSNLFNYMIYVNSQGCVIARFLRIKVRQNPPEFGVTRVGISSDRVPEVEELAERLLGEAGFKGVATAEFKKDPRDNKFKLIEINGRIIASNWLPTYCGVNFPWLMYMDLVEKKQIEVNDYKKNVYWIDLYEDIANSIFRYKEDNLGFRDYIKPYLSRNKTFADVSREDLMPFLKRISVWPIKYYRFFKFRNHQS